MLFRCLELFGSETTLRSYDLPSQTIILLEIVDPEKIYRVHLMGHWKKQVTTSFSNIDKLNDFLARVVLTLGEDQYLRWSPSENLMSVSTFFMNETGFADEVKSFRRLKNNTRRLIDWLETNKNKAEDYSVERGDHVMVANMRCIYPILIEIRDLLATITEVIKE